jgi:hypothetical protein
MVSDSDEGGGVRVGSCCDEFLVLFGPDLVARRIESPRAEERFEDNV